jgi:type II restriction enzyme
MRQDLSHYKSASQRARVASENWVAQNFFCPHCLAPLHKTANNTKAKDFVCHACAQGFELKSKRGAFHNRVVDGAYHAMLAAVEASKAPNLLLLSFSDDFRVKDLVAVPNRFLVKEIIIPRKPLGAHCRRAGWQGCSLDIGLLPPEGRIPCVKDFAFIPGERIKRVWDKTAFLDRGERASRGWLTVTMSLVRRLKKERFVLADLYALENLAQRVFPDNRHVKAKLRQQLQALRDVGWLEFEGKGKYRLLAEKNEPLEPRP